MAPKLKLLSAIPCKRFDASKILCEDGRGGWTCSQVTADRHLIDFEGFHIVFAFSVLVEGVGPDELVQKMNIIAYQGENIVGFSTKLWDHLTDPWNHYQGYSILEWQDCLHCQDLSDGLINCNIQVMLRSIQAPLVVKGEAHLHVSKIEIDDWRVKVTNWDPPWRYNLLYPYRKSDWSLPSWY